MQVNAWTQIEVKIVIESEIHFHIYYWKINLLYKVQYK